MRALEPDQRAERPTSTTTRDVRLGGRRRWSMRTIVVATILLGTLVGQLTNPVAQATPIGLQATPIINEDIVPACIRTADDPYVMTPDVCLAWGRLQLAAVNASIASGGLTNDRTLLLTRGRSTARAMLWAIVVAAAAKPVAARTNDEKLVLTWLAALVRQHNIDVANRALAMFDNFYREQRPGPGSVPCTFTPPFPYQEEYPGKDKARESFCLAGNFPAVFGIGVINKPKSEEWLRWANADVMGTKLTAASGAIARDTAAQLGALSVVAAGGALAVTIPILVGAQIIATSVNVSANIAIAAAGGALVGGVGALLFAAAAILVAALGVYAIIAGSIAIFDNQRPALESTLAEALKPLDLGAVLAKPNGSTLPFTLFNGWLSRQTEPVGVAPAPSRGVASDSRFTDSSGLASPTTPVDSFWIRDERGETRTATMRGGYWILTGPSGTIVSPDLPGALDSEGKSASVRRIRQPDGSFLFVTARADGTSACGSSPCPPSREFYVRGNGTPRTIRYVGTQDGKDNPPLVFDFDKVSTAEIGQPGPFFAAVFDKARKRVTASFTWEIGDRCLTPGVLLCRVNVAANAPKAPDGTQIKSIGTGAAFRYAFPAPGTWWMRAKATTPAGTVASHWFPVEVRNPAPVLAITSPSGDVACSSSGESPCPASAFGADGVTVRGTITDTALKYEVESVTIDWGDGAVESASSGSDIVLCGKTVNGATTYQPCVQFGAVSGDSLTFSANHQPAPGAFGSRTAKVMVRDLGGNIVSLDVPYNIPDTRQTQTVRVNSVPPGPWGTPIDLFATASSGLPITWTASPPNVCVVDGGKLYSTKAGVCIVAATQVGNATYQPATGIQQVTLTEK